MSTRIRERALHRMAAALRLPLDQLPHGLVSALDDALRDVQLAAYVSGTDQRAATSWEDEPTPTVRTAWADPKE